MRRHLPVLTYAACSAVAVLLSACEDTVVNSTLQQENKPPSITVFGPDFPGNAVEVETVPSSLYVVVADPDGFEDIAVVFLDIGSIVLNDVIARRDASSDPPNFCTHRPLYVDNDVVDIASVLPASVPGHTKIFMSRSSGGIFVAPVFVLPNNYYGGSILLVDLQAQSSTFTDWEACASGGFGHFVVNPPTVPTPTGTFITLVDVTLTGITATVYDAAGASASVAFPELRVVCTTSE